LKKATLGISREIWCCNRETGRFDEKLGDSRENRESWQVCYEQVGLHSLTVKAILAYLESCEAM